MVKRKKVFVGMSGGVDSSVAAALLQKAGYDVIGVFIRVWEPPNFKCTWREDRRDAMRVVARLDIPLVTIDLSDQYKKAVVDYMIREYKAGRTPNPDIECNREIKFGVFYDWARAQGADLIATGHYVRRLDARLPLGSLASKLLMARDKFKDQSYFLWTLTQEQLRHCLFPIGEYKKTQVRQIAKKFGLPNAEKKDSQGLCFIGKIEVKEFLKEFIKEKPGKVVSEAGVVIGRHEGAVFYTIGERHSFTVTKKTPSDKPYYVIDKDVKKNILTVSQKPRKQFDQIRNVKLEGVNWIQGPPRAGKVYRARIRHLGELTPITVTLGKAGTIVHLRRPAWGLASGQSLVIYDKNICLGGGVIK